jgi:hypothetical protein
MDHAASPSRRRAERGTRTVLLLAGLALGGACDRSAREVPPSLPLAPSAPVAREAAAEQPLPEPGEAIIRFAHGRVTILAHTVLRGRILAELARLAGFRLEVGALEPVALTVRIEDVSLEVALPTLLGDIAYRVDYGFDPEVGEHVVTRLSLVSPASSSELAAARAPRERPEDESAATAFAEQRHQISAERTRMLKRFREEERAERKLLLAALESPNPEQRAAAISEIDPEGPGAESLFEVVYGDPDPRTREAAVERLEDADVCPATLALVYALEDPDPGVVRRAIGVVQDVGDESFIPMLEPLLRSEDTAIRDAAREAVDYLE